MLDGTFRLWYSYMSGILRRHVQRVAARLSS